MANHQRLHGGRAQGGCYAWNDGARNIGGYITGGPDWFRVSFPGSMGGLAKGGGGRWHQMPDESWWVELPLANIQGTLRWLKNRHRGGLARALRIMAPEWWAKQLMETNIDGPTGLQGLSTATSVLDCPAELRARVEKIVSRTPFPPWVRLYPYQDVGIAFAALSGFRCLIGDSMGLGKSIEAIGCLNYAPSRLLPAAIVTPASMIGTWERELHRFAPWLEPYPILTASGDFPVARKRTVYLLSWAMLDRVAADLLIQGVRCVIFDESHNVRNPRALRSRAALDLSTGVEHVLLLTGTPMLNRPSELWHQLHCINPEAFPTAADFAERFPREKIRALSGELRKYMVRRLKSDVAGFLPKKVRTSVWNPLDEGTMAAYRKVEEKLYQWMVLQFRQRATAEAARMFLARMKGRRKAESMEVLKAVVAEVNEKPPDPQYANEAITKLGYLRRFVGKAKVPSALRWIRDRRLKDPSPLLVFVEHHAVRELLAVGLDRQKLRWTYIDGTVSGAGRRDDIVQNFQMGAYDVLVLSQAAHTGLTLTAASDVLFVERWWVPALEEQAEDRAARIGQQAAFVNVHYLMAPKTVDEHIAALVDNKRQLFNAVLGSEPARRENQGNQSDGYADLHSLIVKRVLDSLEGQGKPARVTIADVLAYMRGKQQAA